MINYFKNVVIIAPHPDDETLSMGGSIKRLTMNNVKVSILIVSGHLPPLYKKKILIKLIPSQKKYSSIWGSATMNFLKYLLQKLMIFQLQN